MRPLTRHTLTALAALLTIVAAPTVALADSGNAFEDVSDEELLEREREFAEDVAARINRLRVDNGLEPLAIYPNDEHARYMAHNFEGDHALFEEAGGYDGGLYGQPAGEVWGGGNRNSGTATLTWEESPGHFDALTLDMTHVVVGVDCSERMRSRNHGSASVVAHLIDKGEVTGPTPVADQPHNSMDNVVDCNFREPQETLLDTYPWLPQAGAGLGGFVVLLLLVRALKNARSRARVRKQLKARPVVGAATSQLHRH